MRDAKKEKHRTHAGRGGSRRGQRLSRLPDERDFPIVEVQTDSLTLHDFRCGGDEPPDCDKAAGFSVLRSFRHPLLICRKSANHPKVLDGKLRLRGALEAGKRTLRAYDLGRLSKDLALGYVVRTGLLRPLNRDPWILCTRIEELEELRPDLRRPSTMAAFLGVPEIRVLEIKRIRNLEGAWDDHPLFNPGTAFDFGVISLRELLTIAEIPNPEADYHNWEKQNDVLGEYVAGPRRLSRLRSLVTRQLVPAWACR